MTIALFLTQNWINLLSTILTILLVLFTINKMRTLARNYLFFLNMNLGTLLLGSASLINLFTKIYIIPNGTYAILKLICLTGASLFFLIALLKLEQKK